MFTFTLPIFHSWWICCGPHRLGNKLYFIKCLLRSFKLLGYWFCQICTFTCKLMKYSKWQMVMVNLMFPQVISMYFNLDWSIDIIYLPQIFNFPESSKITEPLRGFPDTQTPSGFSNTMSNLSNFPIIQRGEVRQGWYLVRLHLFPSPGLL